MEDLPIVPKVAMKTITDSDLRNWFEHCGYKAPS